MRIPKCYHLLATFENVSLYLTTPIVDFSSSLMHTFFEFFKKKNSKIQKKIYINSKKIQKKNQKKKQKKKFGVKKSKAANLPKRVLPKFRADRSHVRRVRGRLSGIREV